MSRTERFTVSVQRNGGKVRHEVFTKYSVIACPIQHGKILYLRHQKTCSRNNQESNKNEPR